MFEWHCKTFDQLDSVELYKLLQARSAVFIFEQRCVFGDIDGLDLRAVHLFALDSSDPELPLAACARLFGPEREDRSVAIGRVLTTQPYRGGGLGQALMQRALDEAAQRWPDLPIRLNAQQHLRAFYEAFGFKKVSGPYLEDGIPHIEMRRADLSLADDAPTH